MYQLNSWLFIQHQFKMLTSQRIKSIMQCNDVESLRQYDFPAILKPRIPGTEGHEEVKEVRGMSVGLIILIVCKYFYLSLIVYFVTAESVGLLSLEYHAAFFHTEYYHRD